MELEQQPTRRDDGTAHEHHDFYLPAMPPRRLVASLRRFVTRLRRFD